MWGRSGQRGRIAATAASAGWSGSAFLVSGPVREADVVVAQTDCTAMRMEQFDALIGSLEIADEAPALAAVAEARRRFSRA
jgi:uncharacterized protein (DUF1778 family)